MATGMHRTIRAPFRPTIEELLYDQQGELDQLLRDVSGGIRSGHHYDALEARASLIGQKLRDAFRSGRVGR